MHHLQRHIRSGILAGTLGIVVMAMGVPAAQAAVVSTAS
jgi:hypothetical protein